MRIVIASCSAVYTGRGDTTLAAGVRAIIFKDDGSISIHNDKSNKPLNYMGKDNVLTETLVNGLLLWSFDTRKESLQITLHNVISDTNFELHQDDAGLVRDGTENQLQAWLADNPEQLGEGFTLVSREYPTGAGPVDLLCLDKDGNAVAVEVKRVAMLGAVDQANRYVESLRNVGDFKDVRGMVAALDIRPNTVKLAERKSVECVTLPKEWREGQKETIEIDEPPLQFP